MALKLSPTARIEGLEAAKRRIEQIEDRQSLSSKPMAELLNVSWPTLRGWCDSVGAFTDSKAFIRGGNGIEWEFDPVKTVDALLSHFRGELDKRQDHNRRVVESAGIEMDPSEASNIDIVDLKRQVDLTIAIQEQKMRVGGYVPAPEVTNFLRGYNQAAIGAVLGTGTSIDPTGALPSNIRSAMDELLREVAATMNQRCTEYIRSFSAGFVEAGDSRAV